MYGMERCNLKKLNKAEDQEHCEVSISNKFTALENSDGDVDIDKAWEIVKENIKISTKQIIV
jgi:hypothetical protein